MTVLRIVLFAGVFLPLATAQSTPKSTAAQGEQCTGRATPPPAPAINAKPYYSFKNHPILSNEIQQWAWLGYHLDQTTGRLLDPKGNPVSQAFVDWMNKPADLSHRHIDQYLFDRLPGDYVLDVKTCHLVSAAGDHMPRLVLESLLANIRNSYQMSALEQVQAMLTGLKPNDTVPKTVLDRLRSLRSSGIELPPELLALLKRNESVGQALPQIQGDYASLTQLYDRTRSLPELVSAASPLSAAPASSPQPIYHDDEKRLGALLTAEMHERLTQNPFGLELLSRLKNRKGVLMFPAMVIRKVAQARNDPNQEWANMGDEAVTINYWVAERFLLDRASPAERARLQKAFAQPNGLVYYLAADAAARSAFLDAQEDTLFHELVHYWQKKRSPYDLEETRGNLPDGSLLNKEYEAHRLEACYALTTALKDPSKLERINGERYLDMLKDYDSYRDGITRKYMNTYAGSQELPDVIQRQKVRKATASWFLALNTLSGNVIQSAVQTLKLAGYSQGDKALSRFKTDADWREYKFLQTTLPALRLQMARLSEKLAGTRPDLSLFVLNALPEKTLAAAAITPEKRAAIFTATREVLVNPRNPWPLERRIAAYEKMQATDYPSMHKDAGILAAWARDLKTQAADLTIKAKATNDATARKDLLDKANYAQDVAYEWLGDIEEMPLRNDKPPAEIQGKLGEALIALRQNEHASRKILAAKTLAIEDLVARPDPTSTLSDRMTAMKLIEKYDVIDAKTRSAVGRALIRIQEDTAQYHDQQAAAASDPEMRKRFQLRRDNCLSLAALSRFYERFNTLPDQVAGPLGPIVRELDDDREPIDAKKEPEAWRQHKARTEAFIDQFVQLTADPKTNPPLPERKLACRVIMAHLNATLNIVRIETYPKLADVYWHVLTDEAIAYEKAAKAPENKIIRIDLVKLAFGKCQEIPQENPLHDKCLDAIRAIR